MNKIEKIEVLAKQCETIDMKITSYNLAGLHALGIVMTAIGGLFAWGIENENNYILIVLPVPYYVVLFYWVNLNTWVLAYGGYKRFLEEAVNYFADELLFMWESNIVRKRHINFSSIVLHLLVLFVLLFLVTVSIYYVGMSCGVWLSIAVNLIHIGFLSCIIVSYYFLYREFQRTYEEAKYYGGHFPTVRS